MRVILLLSVIWISVGISGLAFGYNVGQDNPLRFAPIAHMVKPVYSTFCPSAQDGCFHQVHRVHLGNDLFARKGTPVVSVQDGIVLAVDPDDKRCGKGLHVATHDGWDFIYCHLDRINPELLDPAGNLKEYAVVTAGLYLGNVGNTGNAKTTPSHLHFEVVRDDRDHFDPYPFLLDAQILPEPIK